MGLIDQENLEVNRWAKFKTCYVLVRDGEWMTVARSTRGGRGVQHEIVYDDLADPDKTSWRSTVQVMQAEVADGSTWVVSALPTHLCMLRKLTAPFPSVNKAMKVFPSLLDIEIPFPLEQCEYAFLTPEMDENNHAQSVALAARNEELDQYLGDLDKIDVRPSLLDHEGLALWTQGVVERPPPKGDGARLVVFLGRGHTVLSAGSGRQLLSVHSIRSGAQDLADGSGVTAWNLRIQRFLKSLPASWRTDGLEWIWAGGGASDLALIEQLTLAVEPDLGAPISATTLDQPEHFLVRALARRAMVPGQNSFNFLSGTREDEALVAARRRRNLRTSFFFVACGLLLAISSAVFELYLRSQDRQFQAIIDKQYLNIVGMPNTQRGQEVLLAERALSEVEIQNKPFLSVFSPSLTEPVREVLKHAYRHDFQITRIDIDDGKIEVEGLAPDWDQCEVLETILSEQDFDVALTRSGDLEGRRGFVLLGNARIARAATGVGP